MSQKLSDVILNSLNTNISYFIKCILKIVGNKYKKICHCLTLEKMPQNLVTCPSIAMLKTLISEGKKKHV